MEHRFNPVGKIETVSKIHSYRLPFRRFCPLEGGFRECFDGVVRACTSLVLLKGLSWQPINFFSRIYISGFCPEQTSILRHLYVYNFPKTWVNELARVPCGTCRLSKKNKAVWMEPDWMMCDHDNKLPATASELNSVRQYAFL